MTTVPLLVSIFCLLLALALEFDEKDHDRRR
jgi:hypothetical protein